MKRKSAGPPAAAKPPEKPPGKPPEKPGTKPAAKAQAQPAAVVAARIGIQVEPSVPAAVLHGRHDFMIRGRVVSTVPIAEVALFSGGKRLGQILFGKAEASAPLALPDGTAAGQHNFVFHLSAPKAPGALRIPFNLVARTFDDQGGQAACTVALDLRNPGRARILAGPAEAGIATTGLPPPTVVYAERATLDPDGVLNVQGWAVARELLVGVQVLLDGTDIGAAVLGGTRDDVARAHPAYPNAGRAGFSLTLPIGARAAKAANVTVRATTLPGTATETVLPIERVARREAAARPAAAPAEAAAQGAPQGAPRGASQGAAPADQPADPASDPRRAIDMYCEEWSLGTDGIVSVKGWAVCAAGIAGVGVLVDGRKVGEAEIGQVRLDVGDRYPNIPAARTGGFRLRMRALTSAIGAHTISIIARNGMGDEKLHRQPVVARPIARHEPPAPRRAPPAAPPPPAARNFEFKLDTPLLTGGAMTQPVTGRLSIEGWVLSRAGIAGIEVLLGAQSLGFAHYGVVRRDIAAAHPDWADALRCGFAFQCPPRGLRDGEHTVSLRISAKDGETLVESFRITVAKPLGAGAHARIRPRIPRAEAALYADTLRRLDWQPRFRVLLHGADPAAPERLAATLASLAAQRYPDWRAALPGNDPGLRAAVAALAGESGIDATRIDFIDDAAAAAGFVADEPDAPRTLVGVLASGDRLGGDALAEFAVQSGIHRDAELLYADELRENPASGQAEAFFKPEFSPDLLFATNYIGRPWFAAAGLLARIGTSPDAIAAQGEYDLLLRCAEQAGPRGIHAIPRLLCARGAAGGAEPADIETRALAEAAKRRGIAAAIEPGCMPGVWRARRRVGGKPKVSIIVPTCGAKGLVRACIESLRRVTAHRAIEIVAIDNIPGSMEADKAWLRQAADTVVPGLGAFGWAPFNNRAAAAATGDYLLFMNDDTEVAQPDWLDAMLEHAQRPEVGVVGARLLYPDGKVQHAGLFLAEAGTVRHAFRYAPGEEPGYFGLARTERNVIAVTGACMLMRRATFDALGGFDEKHEGINADLDFCLRAHEAGLLTVITPHATLTHHEQASRAHMKHVGDPKRFERRWRQRFAAGDPYYSPHLSRQFEDYRPAEEPARALTGGHPLFRTEDIARILVATLGDAGDFVTALPAIRRLKTHFPTARIALLAGPAARGLAVLEPAIDETLEFGFASARSPVGRREATAEERAALTRRLAPFAFDLAIDLHKHPDTRPLLRCAGAALTAGFDHLGRFPWLDLALEWEGDRRLHAKRSNVADDLLRLVDTVAAATDDDRSAIGAAAIEALRARAELPVDVRKFLAGPVICMHAGAQPVMKQWPASHFAALIDMLVTRNRTRVLLIGGAEAADIEIEEQVLAAITQGQHVLSAVGRLAPDALAAAIAECALFVGTDSGLHNIAAALGVPTVSVQSATTDPVERAPLGPRAVAIARAMTCGPCYLTRLEDCTRGFACMRGLEPAAVHRACEAMLARILPAVGGSKQADPPKAEPAPAAASAPPSRAPVRKPQKKPIRAALPAGG
jgi:ADP-heptose:LPS heptosyltransferase/GT2 family glycosyltransferase